MINPAQREDLLAQAGWLPAPYDPHATAPCRRMEGIDWNSIGALIESRYGLAGLKA